MQSVVRKFLIRKLPDLSNTQKSTYVRFYLFIGNNIVIRIQNQNGKYMLERKVHTSDLERDEVKLEITKEEFERLSNFTDLKIEREGYLLAEEKTIKIVIYKGKFKGLSRVEVTFDTKEDAAAFTPLGWFGKDITSTPLSQDAKLLDLSVKKFREILKTNQT